MAARRAQGGMRAAGTAPVAKPPVSSAGSDTTAAAPAVLPPGVARYPVLSPLRFDGTLYRPDDPERDEVTMPRVQAAALQPLGVLGDERV